MIIHEIHISRPRIFSVAKSGRRRRCRRKTNESCKTLIVAEFPRCDEIVKRFMKAFMKGFTSHGLNWGPGFASATHVLSRRRAPLKPRGALFSSSTSLYLSLFARFRNAFSLSILESTSFFIIIISVVDTSSFARSCLSLSLFSFSFFPHILVLVGYISRLVFSLAKIFSRPRKIKVRLMFCEGTEMHAICIRKRAKRQLLEFSSSPFTTNFLRGSHFCHYHSYNYCPRCVDVRFRVNWISSAFLFSN